MKCRIMYIIHFRERSNYGISECYMAPLAGLKGLAAISDGKRAATGDCRRYVD